tara:strand:- start:444 stop:914 length:471 start_codon:yes stop_codon:yes gene_type:complete
MRDKHQIADVAVVWDDNFRQAWILARVCFTNTGHILLSLVEDHQNFESFIRLMAGDESQKTGVSVGEEIIEETMCELLHQHYYDVLTPEGMNYIAGLCPKDLVFAISVLTEMTGSRFCEPNTVAEKRWGAIQRIGMRMDDEGVIRCAGEPMPEDDE